MRAVLQVVLLLNVFLLSTVQALSSSSSSSVGEVSELNTSDSCGQQEFINDCWYPVSCKTCLSRSGCAVEVTTGGCVSVDAPNVIRAAVGLYIDGGVDYCSEADPACIACRKSNSTDVCAGIKSCVCVAKCEQISPQPSRCAGTSDVNTRSFILAGAVVMPLLIYAMFKGCCDCSLSCMLRKHRAKQNRRLPGSLKLEAWWKHINQQSDPIASEGFADLELRSCFVPMQSAKENINRSSGGEEGVEVADSTTDIAGAVVATDLAAESSRNNEQHREVTAAQLV